MVDNNKKHCPCEICDLCEVDFGNSQNCLGNKCEVNIRTDERKKTIDEFIDRFDKSTIIMGRGFGRTFMLKCLNDIAKQMKGETNGLLHRRT